MKLARALMFSVAALVLGTPSLQAVTITKIVAFGDSLTDTGNEYLASMGTLPPSPPYYQGRASNGPLYVEQLAAQLGVQAPTPSLRGGTNYAFYGAQTSLTGLSASGTPNMGLQLDAFLSTSPTISADELFVLYGGANDFLFGGQTDPSVPVANLSHYISTLAAQGATNFLIPNLPPLGYLPLTLGTPFETALNLLSVGFNSLLAAELDALELSLGINIFRLDVFSLTSEAFANPMAFGFTNVTSPALNVNTGEVAPNPDEYFFWDPAHPGSVAHRILGDRAAAQIVPEPSSLVLILTSIGVLVPVAWRRERAKRG